MRGIKKIIIDGFTIRDKMSLYEEFNRKLKPDIGWDIAESLDALDDVLYGGYGTIQGSEPVQLIWKNFDANVQLFGREFTIDFYQQKLQYPDQFNIQMFQNALNELKAGKGKTYFDIILEIISEHANIELIKE